jgi:hypothetical protein
MEEFFKPVTDAIEPMLNPISDEPEEESVPTSGGKGAAGKKEEAKKAPPAKAAPAKGGKG